jgi:2-methylcitrate dehydratase PrpD
VTAVEALADLALAERTPEDIDYLRALTLTNVAAGLGDLGAAGALIDALPLDPARPADAAFATTMRLHARTQDDFHPAGRVHVGAVALGAALALADKVEGRLLECLAAGYDVMCAVSVVYSNVAQRRGYRPTGMFGPLGAAAAAAVALGLDRDGIANAIGLATVTTAGTNQSWISGTDEWLLEIGAAARAGVESALWAEAGAVSSPEAIEGPAGWARAFFDDEGASLLLASLEQPRSRIAEVATKPYPVSGIAQVPTRLGCDAREQLDGARPESIILRMSETESAYPGTTNRGPFTSRSDALMSVAFCVACGLEDGLVRLDRLDRPNDADLRSLIERVSLEPDPAVPEMEALLEVSADGETVRLKNDGASVLFPTWQALSAEAATVAGRSEAPEGAVDAACTELLGEYADARQLDLLLKGAR